VCPISLLTYHPHIILIDTWIQTSTEQKISYQAKSKQSKKSHTVLIDDDSRDFEIVLVRKKEGLGKEPNRLVD
jgi:hypothetical protein